jgi:hypothetical protein
VSARHPFRCISGQKVSPSAHGSLEAPEPRRLKRTSQGRLSATGLWPSSTTLRSTGGTRLPSTGDTRRLSRTLCASTGLRTRVRSLCSRWIRGLPTRAWSADLPSITAGWTDAAVGTTV